MAKRENHYEAAFEAYLRLRRFPYLAIDEQRRSLLGEASLKNIDFVVSPPGGKPWLVDVKGRRFAGSSQGQYWKNWTTTDDLRSLFIWEQLHGDRFGALFVFAYNVIGDVAPLPEELLFSFHGRLYGFVAMRLGEYRAEARRISPKWDTWAVPARRFRELAAPFDAYMGVAEADPQADAEMTVDDLRELFSHAIAVPESRS